MAANFTIYDFSGIIAEVAKSDLSDQEATSKAISRSSDLAGRMTDGRWSIPSSPEFFAAIQKARGKE